MRRYLFTVVLFGVAVIPGYAADVIPPYLAGVWATEASVLKGPLLFEGSAIYLGSDGVGAMVGGPPPIGFKIVATFDPATNVIDFDVYEGVNKGPHGKLVYDPDNKTLDSGPPKHEPMRRRFESLSDEIRKALGL